MTSRNDWNCNVNSRLFLQLTGVRADMGPAYFVIAIMGCSDAGTECRTVAMPAAHYASEQACLAARADALMANSDLDFPTLLAQCLPVARKANAAHPEPEPLDAFAG